MEATVSRRGLPLDALSAAVSDDYHSADNLTFQPRDRIGLPRRGFFSRLVPHGAGFARGTSALDQPFGENAADTAQQTAIGTLRQGGWSPLGRYLLQLQPTALIGTGNHPLTAFHFEPFEPSTCRCGY